MSEGTDGVGNDSSSRDTSASQSQSADALGQAMESFSAGLQGAAGALSQALDNPLGAVADALGLSQAIDQIADAFDLDQFDLGGVLGAAITGALTGGLPGAVMGAINAMTGGSLLDAARSAVAENLPEPMQPLANMAIDALASRIPGAAGAMNPANALSAFGGGLLTGGRAPDIQELGALARSLTGYQQTAREVLDAAVRGQWTDAAQAALHLDGVLQGRLQEASSVAAEVVRGFAAGEAPYEQGGRGALGDAAEQVAIAAGRMLFNR